MVCRPGSQGQLSNVILCCSQPMQKLYCLALSGLNSFHPHPWHEKLGNRQPRQQFEHAPSRFHSIEPLYLCHCSGIKRCGSGIVKNLVLFIWWRIRAHARIEALGFNPISHMPAPCTLTNYADTTSNRRHPSRLHVLKTSIITKSLRHKCWRGPRSVLKET